MKSEIPLTVNKLEDDSYHILIKDTALSCEDEWYWVVDSGASRTVLHESFENYFTPNSNINKEELNGIGYKTYSTVGAIKMMELESIEFSNVICNTANLSELQEVYKEKTPYQICGMIGCDFLLRTKAQIDFEKLCLKIFVE